MKKILAGLMRPATMKEAVIVALILSAMLGAQANHIGDFFIDRNLTVGGTRTALSRGTSLPGTCTLGDVFFDTDATAGSNWFGCTATNTWTAQGGGGGGGVWEFYKRVVANGNGTISVHSDFNTNCTLSSDGSVPSGPSYAQFPDETLSKEVVAVLGPLPSSFVSDGAVTAVITVLQLNTTQFAFGASVGCIAPGADYNVLTYNTQVTANTTPTSGKNTNVTLSAISTTGCSAGSLMYARFRRPTGDTSTDIVYLQAVRMSQ